MDNTTKNEAGYVDLLNSMLDIIGIPKKVTKFSDINCECFLLLYEGIIGEPVPNEIIQPDCFSDNLYNMQMLINNLSGDVLHISLSHIRGEDIVSGDRGAIVNLLEIFNELLKCLMTKISEHYLSTVSQDEVATPQLQKTNQTYTNPGNRSSSSNHLSRKEILSREYCPSTVSRDYSVGLNETDSFIDMSSLPMRKMEQQIINEVARVQNGAVQVGQLVESMMKSKKEAEANRQARKQFLCTLIKDYVENSPQIDRYRKKPPPRLPISGEHFKRPKTKHSASSVIKPSELTYHNKDKVKAVTMNDLCDHDTVPVKEKSIRQSSKSSASQLASSTHKVSASRQCQPAICEEISRIVDRTNQMHSIEPINQLFNDMRFEQRPSSCSSRQKKASRASSTSGESTSLSDNSRDSRIRHKQIVLRKKMQEAEYKTRVMSIRRQVMPGLSQRDKVYQRLLQEALPRHSRHCDFIDHSVKENHDPLQCDIGDNTFDSEFKRLTGYLRCQHKELESRERSHQIEYSKMKQDLRQQKVKEIRDLQQDILSTNSDTYFYEKGAQRVVKQTALPYKILNSPSKIMQNQSTRI